MKLRDRRLQNDYEALQELSQRCSRLGAQPRFTFTDNGKIEVGEYPDMYSLTLRVKGIESFPPLRERYEHACTIYLPINYPTEPPKVMWNTPIFHPNIKTLDENDEQYQDLLDQFGSKAVLNQELNEDPELAKWLDGYVCLDTLRENWKPSVGLTALVLELANMVRYQTYSANDPLRKSAAEWAKEKEKLKGYFPLDAGLLEPKEISEVLTLPKGFSS